MVKGNLENKIGQKAILGRNKPAKKNYANSEIFLQEPTPSTLAKTRLRA